MNAKSFFAAACLALLSFSVSAQEIYQVGVTAGSNYSSLRSDLFSTSSGRLSAAVGCTFVVGFGEHFELNQEVVFVQKGASAKAVNFRPEDTPEELTYDYYYNSFEAGLFAGVTPFANIPLTFQAGGFMGTHFDNLDRSAKEVYVGDYESINHATPAIDLNDAFSGIDFGPAFGIAAGKGRMRVNARYYLGTRNLYKNLDFVDAGPSIRTGSLRLSVSYFLK
ncbi:MAG: outer membrane beta-barrel protein [Lewinellaceae bacterium]|nr:outer membrane beta-barrel protein [Lewinellaceae bacterium]